MLQDESCGEVIPGLLLGNLRSLNLVEPLGITHVLSAINFDPPRDLSCCTALRINIADDESENLLMHLPTSYHFIHEALSSGGKVLVHCQGGVSRSASLVAAYLMKSKSLSADEAMAAIEAKWPNASPNEGFLAQLSLFQEMRCSLDEDHPVYRMWCLGKVGEQWESTGWVDPDTFAQVPADAKSCQTLMYRCRKCRYILVAERNVMVVDSETVGHRVFKRDLRYNRQHYRKDNQKDRMDDGQMGASIFLEPVCWMADTITGSVQGKIHCPSCNARLGSFNWSGISDENGNWVIPGFQIHMSKVDMVHPLAPRPVPSPLTVSGAPTRVAAGGATANTREGCAVTHLILDCDGVMVDSEKASCEALRQAILQITGFDIPHEFPHDFYPVFGMDVLSCVEYYCQRFELGETEGWDDCKSLAVSVSDAKEPIYQELTSSGIPAFSGTSELIGRARSLSLGVGIASSGSPTKIAHNLSQSGLQGLVEERFVVSAKVVARGKPAPDVYVEAMRRLGVEKPSHVVVVEDAVNGLKAAKGAGAFAVGITNSLPRERLEPYADMVVDHLDEIDFTKIIPREG